MRNRSHDSRRLQPFSDRSSALNEVDAGPAYVLLVIGASAAELLEELHSDRFVRQRCPLDQSATIVWQVGVEPNTAADELLDEAPPGMHALEDEAVLERGRRYFVPAHRRLWFEGTLVRQAPRLPSDHHPIDRLLMSLAEGWGKRSAALLAVPEAEDGECGLRIIHAVGALGLRRRATLRPKVISGQALISSPEPERRHIDLGRTHGKRRFSGEAVSRESMPAQPVSAAELPAQPSSVPSASLDAPVGSSSHHPERAAPSFNGRASFRISRVFSLPAHTIAAARAACQAAAHRACERGRVRVWLPACKTGGMTYALAMLLSEAAAQSPTPLKVLIYGTDDDEEALTVARTGRYPAGAALGMEPELRARYTFDEGDTIRVSEALREICIFARHELTRDMPMARMDLVVCHRVLEGLSAARRAGVVDGFHYSLRDGGLLLPLDHVEAFSDERFERLEPGYLRVRARRPVRRSSSAPSSGSTELRNGPLANPASFFRSGVSPSKPEAVSSKPEALSPKPEAVSNVPPSRRVAAEAADPLDRFLYAVGLPLLSCDGDLRVCFLSLEAKLVFGLSANDRGASLAQLAPRLPGGLDLLPTAQRALSERAARELSIRTGQRSYLVRVTATDRDGACTVSFAFTDVTLLEAAKAQALARSHQHAALAHITDRALTVAGAEALYDEALGVLFGNIAACSAGVIVELGGKAGQYEVVASRGMGANPLATLRGLGDAVALLDAVAQRGCIVSQGGDRAAWSEEAHATSPARRRRMPRPLSRVARSFACPIAADGEVLGVVALFGRRSRIDDVDHQHFAQAVANVLGATLLRQRARRRLDLELAVSRQLASAADLDGAVGGVRTALGSALGGTVDEIELWAARDAPRQGWRRLFPPHQGVSLPRPWSADILGEPYSEVVYGSGSGDVRELLVPVEAAHLPLCVLRLRGKAWRTLERELAEGLKSITRLLTDFIERERNLERSRQSEAAYRQRTAELEALYASLPVGVSIHDQRGAIRHVNRHLAALQAAPGRSEADPLRRLYASEIPIWVTRVLATGEPCHDVELSVKAGELKDEDRLLDDGSIVPAAAAPRPEYGGAWLCNFAPIRGADGIIVGVSAVVQDITALKRVEATLREADQQKDDFLAMLGHELRNPMAAIRNATELLGRVEQPSPQLLRLQSIFDRQTLQTTKLIDGLLDVARVARGKVELQLLPVQLTDLVRQAVDDRRQQFGARRLDLCLPDPELWVIADRVRLLQIIDNLISNALKFTALQGSIRIEARSFGARGSIVVADNGAGIEAELLPQIFEPFRQGRVHSQSQGLGLGLALVHGLVELHGFKLAAHSAGPGCGASFSIEFPVAPAPETPAPESRVDLRPLHLLLVEDNQDIAETLGELLAASGHRVDAVGSAEEALTWLRSACPDVVLCDIGLPGMDGFELATRLRADPQLKHLRLVAMTGYGDASSRSRIEDAGFDRHLIKPVQMDALGHCLARVAALPAQ